MHSRSIHLLALALAVPAVASAQDRGDTERVGGVQEVERPEKLTQDRPFVEHSELIGRDLTTIVGSEDGDPIDLGDIDDLVVDSRSGKISHLIISSGGIAGIGDTLRAIRVDQVTFEENEDDEVVASVAMSEEAFDAIKEIDDKEDFVGSSAVESAVGRADRAQKDTGLTGKEAGRAREAAATARKSYLLTSLADIDVFASGADEAMSSIGEFVLDVNAGRIAFATIAANDSTYLVPIEKLEIRPRERTDEDDPEPAAMLPMTEEELASAPTVDEKAKATASNPRFRQTVYTFYDVQNPDQGAMRAGQPERKDRKDRDDGRRGGDGGN